MFEPRNCGYWNLGAQEIMFNTLFKSMFSSLVKIMPIDRNGGVNQIALSNFTQRAKYGDWVHMFPEGRTYQDQLKSCRDSQGRRFRPSGRTAPPGRDLGPMKWGVGKVVYDAIMSDAGENSTCTFRDGVNNGKLIVLPYYHLNMEKLMPEDEDLHLMRRFPARRNKVYCMVGMVG